MRMLQVHFQQVKLVKLALGISMALAPSIHAADGSGGGGLADFLKLNEKLPQAVCDESLISRAPTLKVDRETGPDLALTVSADESHLLRFLLGDPGAPIGSPYLTSALTAAGNAAQAASTSTGIADKYLPDLKRKIALEVCTSLVTPGKMGRLFAQTPSWFFPAMVHAPKDDIPAPMRGKALVRVQDVEGRFGIREQKWWVAGWIEPYEVISARTMKREYRRLANPVTNRTQFIQIMGKDELPLGFVYPTAEESAADWNTLKQLSLTEISRQRRVATYKLLIELEAYRVLEKFPKKAESIRKLQEFYKNLISAYELYPEDTQFAPYARKAKYLMKEVEIRNMLDESFFEAMKGAKVNGSNIAFHMFWPDAKLHGMFVEYRDRLSRLK